MTKGNSNPEAKISFEAKTEATFDAEAEVLLEAEPVPEPEPPKMVKKIITCPRCKGSCTWVSSATGVRKETAVGKLSDPKRICPKCQGNGKTHRMITEEQAAAEKEAATNARKTAKAQIDAKARAAKKAIDEE